MAVIHLPHPPLRGWGSVGALQADLPPSCQPQAKGSCFSPCPSPRYPCSPHPQESPPTVPVLGFLCFAVIQEMGLGGPWIPLALPLARAPEPRHQPGELPKYLPP